MNHGEQPREPKGSPSAGRWTTRGTAGAAPRQETVSHRERFRPPAPGGYDELLVTTTGVTEYRAEGRLHRTNGAARFEQGESPQYFLDGEEVDQYEVFRRMAPDPVRFDELYDEGASATISAAKEAVGDVVHLGALLSGVSELRPDDEYMNQAPDLAARAVGSADAAQALQDELRERYRNNPAVDPEVNERAAIRAVEFPGGE